MDELDALIAQEFANDAPATSPVVSPGVSLDDLIAQEFAPPPQSPGQSVVDSLKQQLNDNPTALQDTTGQILQSLGRGAASTGGYLMDLANLPFRGASYLGDKAASLITGVSSEELRANVPNMLRPSTGRPEDAFGTFAQKTRDLVPQLAPEPTTPQAIALNKGVEFVGSALAGGAGSAPTLLGGAATALANYVAPDSPLLEAAAGLAGSLSPSLYKGAITKAANYLNTPKDIAKRVGADITSLTEGKVLKTADDAVNTLLEVSPRFREKIASVSDPVALKANIKEITKDTGQEIQSIFNANKKIAVTREDILNHPTIKAMVKTVNSSRSTSSEKAKVAPVVQEIEEFLAGRSKMSLTRLWEKRKILDDAAIPATSKIPANKQAFFEARQALQDVIEGKVAEAVASGKASPSTYEDLIRLNKEYNGLSILKPKIFKLEAKEGGKNFFQKLQGEIGPLSRVGKSAGAGALAGALGGGAPGALLGGIIAPTVIGSATSPTVAANLFRQAEQLSPDSLEAISRALLPNLVQNQQRYNQ